MLTIRPITALDATELQPYRTLRQSVEQYREGRFVAEGEKVVRRLLETTCRVFSVLVTPEWLNAIRPALEQRTEEIVALTAERSVLESIVGFHLHQGIMALAAIPAAATVDELLHLPSPRLIVALDGLTNAENIGVLVRNCAAFGVQAILAGETSSSPYLRRAVRNSMGAVFTLPVVHSTNLAADLGRLRAAGIVVAAAHPHADGATIQSHDWKNDVCVVVGSEGEGVSAGILAACDASVAIPMRNGIDSLNVANATAVFLYEIDRQRRRGA